MEERGADPFISSGDFSCLFFFSNVDVPADKWEKALLLEVPFPDEMNGEGGGKFLEDFGSFAGILTEYAVNVERFSPAGCVFCNGAVMGEKSSFSFSADGSGTEIPAVFGEKRAFSCRGDSGASLFDSSAGISFPGYSSNFFSAFSELFSGVTERSFPAGAKDFCCALFLHFWGDRIAGEQEVFSCPFFWGPLICA